MAIGCGTTTKGMSPTPPATMADSARPMKSEVAMVTVGISSFSSSIWYTTSIKVQAPQSACDAITRSGLYVSSIDFAAVAAASTDEP